MKNLYIFDCFGVIFAEVAPVWFLKHYRKEEASIKAEKFFEGSNIGLKSFDQVVELISQDLNIPCEDIKKEWLDLESVNHELLDAIKELKKNNNTAMLSNAPEGLVEWMFKYYNIDPNEYFDHVFISADYHLEKPDLKFFKVCLDYFKDNKYNRITMVDDRPSNLKEVHQLGIEPILMTSNQEVIANLKK